MNSEKEAQMAKYVGIISALCLVFLLAGVSYFLISNQQTEKLVEVEVLPLEEPVSIRSTNASENELLYAAAEFARSIEAGEPITIGEPLEGSPGAYIVHVEEQEEGGMYSVDAFGNMIFTGDEIEIVTSDSHVKK